MGNSLINKNKLNDIVSVKDFGAVGDGVTDDTASADLTYAKAYVRGSATNKFFARCNGTIWTFSDGTTVS